MKKKMTHLSRRFSREVPISHEEMSMTFTYMHCTKVYIRTTSTISPLAQGHALAVKISSCSSALGSRSDGQRPTFAAFGGSVAGRPGGLRARAAPAGDLRRAALDLETSTISGRTGPLDPGHFDASRGDMSVLGHRLISGARGIAKEWCHDGIPRVPLIDHVHHHARARGSPGGARRARRVVVAVSAGPSGRSTRLRHSRGV